MRFYLRVFAVALLCFSTLIGTGAYAYIQSGSSGIEETGEAAAEKASGDRKVTPEDRLDLETMVRKSARVNVLMMGSDGGRSDTMMLVSFDPDMKLMDIVSVPRDTYHPVPGHTAVGAQKLNAVYGFKGEEGGPEGVARQVEKLLGVPVNYYVNIDYDAVREIVDILGGIPVEISEKMNYDDPYDDPPLSIHFEKGSHLLTGEDAVKYLRWRKNNDEEGAGDLGRIQRQHGFVKAVVKKAVSLKLPQVIRTSFKHVRTDMKMDKMLMYGVSVVGMDMEMINSTMIPGEVTSVDGLSCYVHDPEATETLLLGIYNRTEEKAAEEAEAEPQGQAKP